jgi:hypothetical protein
MTDSILLPVVHALQADGQTTVVARPEFSAHGDPPEWRMSSPLDRARVEEQFDLGPLVWWHVGPRGEWTLVDSLTRATWSGSGDPVEYAGIDGPAVGREPAVDGVALERMLPEGGLLTYGANSRNTWVSNGWTTVLGPLPAHGPPGAAGRTPRWRRR